MARRNLVDIDNKIINAVYKIGAKHGISAITSAKIAKMCGISHFTCFEHFGTMRGLLDAASQKFDRKYMAFIPEMIENGLSPQKVFLEILNMFLKDSDGALFYNNYTLAFGFNSTLQNDRSQEFLPFCKLLFQAEKTLSDDEYLILWDYITSMAFYYTEKIVHNYIPNTNESIKFICDLVFYGIKNYI